MSDESIKYQLLNALYSHNSEEALYLLSLLINPHKVKYSYDNTYILHQVVLCDVLDIVHVLINEYQFDPHCVNDYGLTPLHYAAITEFNGHLSRQLNIIKYLIIECHCNPLSTSKDGAMPLDYANKK